MAQKLSDIKTFTELEQYLQQKGVGHQNYRHYTNLDNIISMLDSGYLWLSRGDQLNDRQELSKGNPAEWEKIYLASFVYGRSENIAMWAIYGLPHDEAACLSLPSMEINKWVSGIKTLHDPSDGYKKIEAGFTAKMIDVVYIGGKRGQKDTLLQWNGERLYLDEQDNKKKPELSDDFTAISSAACLTGCIKNYAWVYENEVRIQVKLDQPIDCTRIAIRFPDNFFVPVNVKGANEQDKVCITYGPWKDIRKSIQFDQAFQHRTGQYGDKITFADSEFNDLVRLKELCEYCTAGKDKRMPGRLNSSIFS